MSSESSEFIEKCESGLLLREEINEKKLLSKESNVWLNPMIKIARLTTRAPELPARISL